jgi:hypothetical protein
MRYFLSARNSNGLLTRIEQRAFLIQRREAWVSQYTPPNDRFCDGFRMPAPSLNLQHAPRPPGRRSKAASEGNSAMPRAA